MALIAAEFATGAVTLTGTTADSVNLYQTGTHKLLVTNVSGATLLHFNVNDITTVDVKAQGGLTLAVKPTAADDFVIGSTTYTYVAALTGAANEIVIGANVTASQVNTNKAFGITAGGEGSVYSTGLVLDSAVSAIAFSSDIMVFTAAILEGIEGEGIVMTETFTSGSNVMDGSGTIGGTTAGVDAVPTTATAAEDHHVVPAGQTLELNSHRYGIGTNGLVMSIVGNANVYLAQLTK